MLSMKTWTWVLLSPVSSYTCCHWMISPVQQTRFPDPQRKTKLPDAFPRGSWFHTCIQNQAGSSKQAHVRARPSKTRQCAHKLPKTQPHRHTHQPQVIIHLELSLTKACMQRVRAWAVTKACRTGLTIIKCQPCQLIITNIASNDMH